MDKNQQHNGQNRRNIRNTEPRSKITGSHKIKCTLYSLKFSLNLIFARPLNFNFCFPLIFVHEIHFAPFYFRPPKIFNQIFNQFSVFCLFEVFFDKFEIFLGKFFINMRINVFYAKFRENLFEYICIGRPIFL